MKKVYILLLTVLITAIGFAQAPEGFNYQALARNASGNLIVSTPIGVKFKLHEDLLTGTVVYTETHTVTTNSYSAFTLVVGEGTTTDVFADIIWGAKSHFLEVSIDLANGTAYSSLGTSQLLSVPYALHTKTAGNGIPLDGQEGQILSWEQGAPTWVTPADNEAPSVPLNIVAINITETTADVSWDASTDNVGVDSYEIYQDGLLITTVATPSYQFTNLPNIASTNIAIRAKDAAGNVSDASANFVLVTQDVTPPSIPINFIATNITETTADLS
ncbi:hypothetical protein [Aurantibacter sp.]|uniref:hypothetical protein n=1 Tax=Aurantibacter sp. TaxID=2807103 RepID=UPI0035C7EC95